VLVIFNPLKKLKYAFFKLVQGIVRKKIKALLWRKIDFKKLFPSVFQPLAEMAILQGGEILHVVRKY
jgi:hypothetical protein